MPHRYITVQVAGPLFEVFKYSNSQTPTEHLYDAFNPPVRFADSKTAIYVAEALNNMPPTP